MNRRASGEGTVWKRKDGSWVAQTAMSFGRKSFTSRKSRAHAIGKRDEWLRLRGGSSLATIHGSSTLREYLDSWLSSVELSLAPRTAEGYRIHCKHVSTDIGSIPLSKIGPHHIRAVIDALSEIPATARKVRRTLSQALKQAVEWELIRSNPAAKTRAPKAPKTEIRPFYPDEVKRWLAYDHGKHAALVLLLTLAGPRLGEALGLEWRHVDLDGKKITFNQSLQRHSHTLHIVDTKNKASRRTIVVGARVIEALRTQRRTQKEARLKSGAKWHAWPDRDFVFTNSIGRPLEPRRANEIITEQMKAAKVEVRRVHDLRHTAATEQLRRGTPWHTVQHMLGHGSVLTTVTIYGHLVPGMMDDAAKVMDSMGE